MDSLPFIDSQSDYDDTQDMADYDEFDFDEDDAFCYYEAIRLSPASCPFCRAPVYEISSDESDVEAPDSQPPSPSPTQVM